MKRLRTLPPATIALIVCLVASIAAAVALTSAGTCPAPDPQPSATPTASTSPTPTSTPTPEPSPSETPTPEPSESLSPTPTPLVSLPTLDPTMLPTLDPSALPTPSQSSPTPESAETPAADPCREGALTITVDPPAGVYGTVFAISGVLTCDGSPVADAIVTVTRLTADPYDFETSAARTTDADGRYRAWDRPSAGVEYVATWRGGASCGAGARSPLAHASVKPGVITNPATQRVPAGTAAIIEGRVVPAHPGGSVVLHLLHGSGKRWIEAGSAALDVEGRYRFEYVKGDGPGWLVFRVGFPTQDGDHVWNVGRNVRADWR